MFKRISIFTKLTVAISFCLAFFLLILGMIIIDLQENSLIEEKKRNAEKITLLFSKMSSFHIEKYSYFMLDENTTYLQAKVDNERDILSVIVKDANGRKLNPSGISEDKIDIPTKYRLKIEKMCKGSNGDIIGKVEIIFSLESIYRKILNIRLIYISIVLSTILILNILLGILIYFIINKPLKNLTVAVERFNSNNFDVSLKSQSNDEIGFLSKTFLDMALNLKNSFLEIERQSKEIENYNKNLELLVQERTHELEKSNNELLKINERIKAELQIAQKIQLAIIPKVLPVSDFINLSGKYMPMTDLGGDYYDVFNIDENKIVVLIADVCGHGVPAALITSMAKFSFRNHSYSGRSTSEVLKRVNEELYSIIGKEEYLTVFYGIIDIEKGILEYTNAGHNDVYILKENGNIEVLPANSYLVGFMNNIDFVSNSISLEKGDRIVLYTDGIPEAKNSNKDLFGYERLKDILLRSKNLIAEKAVNFLMNEVNNYIGDYPQNDDMTLLFVDIIKDGEKIKIDFGFATERISDSSFFDNTEISKNIKELNKMLFEAIESYKLSKFEKAKNILLTIKDRYNRKSDNFIILTLLGHCFYKLKEYENAITSWQEALNLNPDNYELRNNIKILEKEIKRDKKEI